MHLLFVYNYICIISRFVIHKSRVVDGWAVPFLGSDRSVVLRSQRYFYNHDKKRPIRMQTYLNIRSFFDLIVVILCGCLFGALLNFKFGRRLLLKVIDTSVSHLACPIQIFIVVSKILFAWLFLS